MAYTSFHLNDSSIKYFTQIETANRKLVVKIDYQTVLTINSEHKTIAYDDILLKKLPLEELKTFFKSLDNVHSVWKTILKENVDWQKYINQISDLEFINNNPDKIKSVGYDSNGLIQSLELKDGSFLSKLPEGLKLKVLLPMKTENYQFDETGFRQLKGDCLLFEKRIVGSIWEIWDSTKQKLLLQVDLCRVLFRDEDYCFSKAELEALTRFATPEQYKEIVATNYKVEKVQNFYNRNYTLHKYEDSAGNMVKDKLVDKNGKYGFTNSSCSACDWVKKELYWKTPEGQNILVLHHESKEFIYLNEDKSKITKELIESVKAYSISGASKLEALFKQEQMEEGTIKRTDHEGYYNLASYLSNDFLVSEQRFDIKTNKPFWNKQFPTETHNSYDENKNIKSVKRIWKDPEGNVLVSCEDQKTISIETKKELSSDLIASIFSWHSSIPNLNDIIKKHNSQFMEKVERIEREDFGFFLRTMKNGAITKEELFDKQNKPYYSKSNCSVFKQEGENKTLEWKDKEGNVLCTSTNGIVEFTTQNATEELLSSVQFITGANKAVESMRAKMRELEKKSTEEDEKIKKTEVLDKDKLQKILKDHQLWLFNDPKGQRANLEGADLSGANLEEANLYGANLSGANLEGANLEEANLYGANLSGANLEGANLEEANLRGANLIGADLERANLYEANLEGANLSEANLSGANLRGANLYGANLRGANLEGANLRGANLIGADLKGANLEEANLYGANLRGANLIGADLWGANLRGADLSGAIGIDLKKDKTNKAEGKQTVITKDFEFKKTLRNDGVTVFEVPKEIEKDLDIIQYPEKHGLEKKNLIFQHWDYSANAFDSKEHLYMIQDTRIVSKIEDGIHYLQAGVDYKTVDFPMFKCATFDETIYHSTKFGYKIFWTLPNEFFETQNLKKDGSWYYDEITPSVIKIQGKDLSCEWHSNKNAQAIAILTANKKLELSPDLSKEEVEIITKCAIKYGYVPERKEETESSTGFVNGLEDLNFKSNDKSIKKEETKTSSSSFVSSVGQRILTRKLTKIIQGALTSQLVKGIGNKRVREETQESISNFFKSEMGKGFLGLAIGSVVSMLSDVEMLKGKKDLITSLSDELQVEGMSVLGEESLDFIVENTLPLFSSFFKEATEEEKEESTRVRVVNETENNVTVNINFQHELEQGLKVINATSHLTNEK